MKKAILILSVLLIQFAFANISDYEILVQTNEFMNQKCINFDTKNAMNSEISADFILVEYENGWAKIGLEERPPHDDSGKLIDEKIVVVYKYSCL